MKKDDRINTHLGNENNDVLCYSHAGNWYQAHAYQWHGIDLGSVMEPIVYVQLISAYFKQGGRHRSTSATLQRMQELLLQLFWYSLWTVKFPFICLPLMAKRKILLHVFLYRNDGYRTIESLRREVTRNIVFISLGNIFSIRLLFHPYAFVYPSPLIKYIYGISKTIRIIRREMGDEFKRYFDRTEIGNAELYSVFNTELGNMLRYVSSIRFLVGLLHRAGKKSFYLSDGDNFGVRKALAHFMNTASIATTVIQHGIDLQRPFFDDCYSNNALVWGMKRKEHLEKHSRHICKTIVVGNSSLDDFETTQHCIADQWVYFPSTFNREKQLSSYRDCNKSIEVLSAINSICKTKNGFGVTVKLHPGEDIDAFTSSAQRESFSISFNDMKELLHKADLVFTEDTTVCFYSLVLHKTTIYVNNSILPPRIPLLEYNAGFIINTVQEIDTVMVRIAALSKEEVDEIHKNQQRMVVDYLGFTDGQNKKRLINAINEITDNPTSL